MSALSVVIPCYRSSEPLLACLRALAPQIDQVTDEVIIVDSSDDLSSLAPLQSAFPFVRWHCSPRRLFPGAARNRGFALARHARVAFLDADVVVSTTWRQGVDSLSPDIIAASGPVEPLEGGNLWGLARYWIEFGEFSKHNLRPTSWNVPSCNMIWKRAAFADTAGFPEKFLSSDDLVFNYREMKLRGRSFRLQDDLAVFHPACFGPDAVRAHIENLGRWSGVARSCGVRPDPGSTKAAAALLYAYRLSQVWRRCRRGQGAAEAARLTPAIVRGTAWWCRGFYAGVREGTECE